MPSAPTRRKKTHDFHVIVHRYPDGSVYYGKPQVNYWTSVFIGHSKSPALRYRLNIRLK